MLMGKFPGWYLAYDKYNATHKVRILSMAAMSKKTDVAKCCLRLRRRISHMQHDCD